jgi:hypothetical protein
MARNDREPASQGRGPASEEWTSWSRSTACDCVTARAEKSGPWSASSEKASERASPCAAVFPALTSEDEQVGAAGRRHVDAGHVAAHASEPRPRSGSVVALLRSRGPEAEGSVRARARRGLTAGGAGGSRPRGQPLNSRRVEPAPAAALFAPQWGTRRLSGKRAIRFL